jgi:hypothetical protein
VGCNFPLHRLLYKRRRRRGDEGPRRRRARPRGGAAQLRSHSATPQRCFTTDTVFFGRSPPQQRRCSHNDKLGLFVRRTFELNDSSMMMIPRATMVLVAPLLLLLLHRAPHAIASTRCTGNYAPAVQPQPLGAAVVESLATAYYRATADDGSGSYGSGTVCACGDGSQPPCNECPLTHAAGDYDCCVVSVVSAFPECHNATNSTGGSASWQLDSAAVVSMTINVQCPHHYFTSPLGNCAGGHPSRLTSSWSRPMFSAGISETRRFFFNWSLATLSWRVQGISGQGQHCDAGTSSSTASGQSTLVADFNNCRAIDCGEGKIFEPLCAQA